MSLWKRIRSWLLDETPEAARRRSRWFVVFRGHRPRFDAAAFMGSAEGKETLANLSAWNRRMFERQYADRVTECYQCMAKIYDNDDARVCIECGGRNERVR